MRRVTGLPVDLELRLFDLFQLLSHWRGRGLVVQAPELQWLQGLEPGSWYVKLQRGPLLVIGQHGPDYLFVRTENCFSDHAFVPGIAACEIFGHQPAPFLKLYPEDAGPWWSVLAAALPTWEAAVDEAILMAEGTVARGRLLEQARTLVEQYQERANG